MEPTRTKTLESAIINVLCRVMPERVENTVIRARIHQVVPTQNYTKREINKQLHQMHQRGHIKFREAEGYKYWYISQEQHDQLTQKGSPPQQQQQQQPSSSESNSSESASVAAAVTMVDTVVLPPRPIATATATETVVSTEQEEYYVISYKPLGSTQLQTITREKMATEQDFVQWLAAFKKMGYVLSVHKQCNTVQRRCVSYDDMSVQYLSDTIGEGLFQLTLTFTDPEKLHTISYYQKMEEAQNAVRRMPEKERETIASLQIQRITSCCNSCVGNK
jgi:hypothetical protein